MLPPTRTHTNIHTQRVSLSLTHTEQHKPWQHWWVHQPGTQRWSWCCGRQPHEHQYTAATWPGWHDAGATRQQPDDAPCRHGRYVWSLHEDRCWWWRLPPLAEGSVVGIETNVKACCFSEVSNHLWYGVKTWISSVGDYPTSPVLAWKCDRFEFVCWLLNVPATCKCISGTDLNRQFYLLPHWNRSCRSNFLLHPVTVYWHRANKSQCLP